MSSERACRVCGSTAITKRGEVEYLQGLRCTVYDCGGCSCRFTPHVSGVHQQLHQQPAISYYNDYIALADRCAARFRAGDLDGLRRELISSPKYRYVIDHVDRLRREAKILEVGCARGHLTSYSILSKRNIRGLDVSPEAIAAARSLFGDHFAIAGTQAATQNGPYDVVYHVGLIGCVADPLALTRQLLGSLRPGGELLFNAPNRDALNLPGQLWLDSAPPPEVITLFPEGFWRRRFSGDVTVTETVDHVDPDASVRMSVRRLLGVRWQAPVAQPLSAIGAQWTQPSAGLRDLVAGAVAKAGRLLGLNRLASARPAEFGIFVRMVKNA